MPHSYRRVAIDAPAENVVTVGIEAAEDGTPMAAVWWNAKAGVEAGEEEYHVVTEALAAAEAARQLHDFDEVVVVLQHEGLWDSTWGTLIGASREPIGNIEATDLSSDEAFNLAKGIEAERDA